MKKITSVGIPSKVKKIGAYAFNACDNLENVYFGGDVPKTFGTRVFNKPFGGAEIKIHYFEGKDGWTEPTWTTPDGITLNSDGEPVFMTSDIIGESHYYAKWKKVQTKIESVDISGRIGTQFTVKWEITDNSGFAGMTTAIAFDNSKIKLVGYTKTSDGSLETDFIGMISNLEEPGINISDLSEVRVSFARPTDTKKCGLISELVFEVIDTFETTQVNTVHADFANAEIGTVLTEVENGVITAHSDINVKYDACGGQNAPSAQTKVHGEELIISTEVPTRSSYDFEGWATEKGGAVVYESGDVYSENKDVTLYAVWKWKPSKSAPLITVEKCVGNVGDTVDVNVLISRNIGIAGFTFNIAFDNTKLEIVSAEKSDLLKGAITTTIDGGNETSALNNIKVVYATPTDFTGDGALFTLKFKVKEDAEIGKTPITLTYRENDVVNKNLEEVGRHVENGEIDIENILFGDAHRDGNIDTKDAVRIMQYLAGWQVDIWLKAADVNNDGQISTMDAVLLSQYLAGWDVKLGEKK